MKITNINTYLVRPRWCFVEMETDEGLTGWGEAVLEGGVLTLPPQTSAVLRENG